MREWDGGGGGSGQEWSSLDGEGRVVAGGVGRGRMVVVGRGRGGIGGAWRERMRNTVWKWVKVMALC